MHARVACADVTRHRPARGLVAEFNPWFWLRSCCKVLTVMFAIDANGQLAPICEYCDASPSVTLDDGLGLAYAGLKRNPPLAKQLHVLDQQLFAECGVARHDRVDDPRVIVPYLLQIMEVGVCI